jgi:16S rRNA (uracil1498-N3)-methyltransferase
MVERDDRPAIATLLTGETLAIGSRIALEDAPAQHARVRRLKAGDAVRLLDGRGLVASGAFLAVTKREVAVAVHGVTEHPRPAPLDVIVPIADRDRMLLAAEKCVELRVTGWRPVYFARSRSVSPRGEGDKFRDRIRARMEGALEQSGNAWMPDLHDDSEAMDVLRSTPVEWNRLLLHPDGAPLAELAGNDPTVVAVGPEGGLEGPEIAAAEALGWHLASLGPITLRFETAVIAAVAVVRASQQSSRSL